MIASETTRPPYHRPGNGWQRPHQRSSKVGEISRGRRRALIGEKLKLAGWNVKDTSQSSKSSTSTSRPSPARRKSLSPRAPTPVTSSPTTPCCSMASPWQWSRSSAAARTPSSEKSRRCNTQPTCKNYTVVSCLSSSTRTATTPTSRLLPRYQTGPDRDPNRPDRSRYVQTVRLRHLRPDLRIHLRRGGQPRPP